MNPKLSTEIVDALNRSSGNPLEVVDPTTDKVYVVCDPELQQRAKAVLDREAIAKGIREMEAGSGIPVDEAFACVREKLESDFNE